MRKWAVAEHIAERAEYLKRICAVAASWDKGGVGEFALCSKGLALLIIIPVRLLFVFG